MLCLCGCGETTTIFRKKFRKFIHGHHVRLLDQKGFNGRNYKQGRHKHKKYWMLLLSNYYSTDSRGYVREHVYFFERYNKCCMLPWGDVHHKDFNTENNMPWNLMGLMHYQHKIIDNYVNVVGRQCSNPNCETPDITALRKNGSLKWHKDGKGGWLCNRCYMRIYHETVTKQKLY